MCKKERAAQSGESRTGEDRTPAIGPTLRAGDSLLTGGRRENEKQLAGGYLRDVSGEN